MQLVINTVYIIEIVLMIASIINLLRLKRYLDTKDEEIQELIKAKEANQELRFENYEYENIFKVIYKIANEKGQGSIEDRFNKIKEVIQSANKNNF